MHLRIFLVAVLYRALPRKSNARRRGQQIRGGFVVNLATPDSILPQHPAVAKFRYFGNSNLHRFNRGSLQKAFINKGLQEDDLRADFCHPVKL
jgi:hypothetical protein